jgi:hypothetical protein
MLCLEWGSNRLWMGKSKRRGLVSKCQCQLRFLIYLPPYTDKDNARRPVTLQLLLFLIASSLSCDNLCDSNEPSLPVIIVVSLGLGIVIGSRQSGMFSRRESTSHKEQNQDTEAAICSRRLADLESHRRGVVLEGDVSAHWVAEGVSRRSVVVCS